MSLEQQTLNLIGRNSGLFDADIKKLNSKIISEVSKSNFLVIGGAGSIGQAVTKEIFKRNPKKLHVVDISENNMVELVRDIRSDLGYIDGDFQTFAIDCGSNEFHSLIEKEGPYDFVLNLSALKHVRSEKDPYTLMRMIDVNILNTIKTIELSKKAGARKYFCVSTDKAANPVNMMGASKRIMEMFLMKESESISISTARFANVAFSDGSLLHGFNQRILKRQPIAAPNDVRRYFVTAKESGELCLMSCILGGNRDIFFPKLSKNLNLITFSEIAEKYLEGIGYRAFKCDSENQARETVEELAKTSQWPCFFFESDTTGEKDFEEFYTKDENLFMDSFDGIGVIKNSYNFEQENLDTFLDKISEYKTSKVWNKSHLIELFNNTIPGFSHKEKGKYLDQKM
tara:strand:+ start:3562 stop:4761 length:1200 start_codon:yes stop_codon:yes gene_type:complete